MKVEKRERFVKSLYAAIHTLSGRMGQADLSAAENEPTVKSCCLKPNKNGNYYYAQMNLNKVVPGTMLKSYSEFLEVLDDTLNKIGATEIQITRADLAINSDNEEDFELFKKLHRLLICCIAEAFEIQNCYQTADLWTNQSLSIAIKGNSIEAENYNKELESKGQTEAKNRLELRSKRMIRNLPEEFQNKWFERLDKAVEQFQSVQQHYNYDLAGIWEADLLKPKDERDFISVTAFLLRYKECIFTRKQLVNLLEMIGIKNPKNKAKKFKEKHKIEFYSLTDVKVVVQAIKDTITKYFEN